MSSLFLLSQFDNLSPLYYPALLDFINLAPLLFSDIMWPALKLQSGSNSQIISFNASVVLLFRSMSKTTATLSIQNSHKIFEIPKNWFFIGPTRSEKTFSRGFIPIISKFFMSIQGFLSGVPRVYGSPSYIFQLHRFLYRSRKALMPVKTFRCKGSFSNSTQIPSGRNTIATYCFAVLLTHRVRRVFLFRSW